MTPSTQFVLMVENLVAAPTPLKTSAGAWYTTLRLRNRVQQADGAMKSGPPFIVILRGRASEPGMPIYTAKAGCTVMVIGRIKGDFTKKGIFWRVESGWVNVILHPGASKHMKFAQTPSAPPMDAPIDISELMELTPDNSAGALEEMLMQMGVVSMLQERDYTENLLTEQIAKRLKNEKIKAIRKTGDSHGRVRKTAGSGQEPGLAGG